MRIHLPLNKRGITLIELLVALVIGAVAVGAIYKVFVAQTKAYTVQDQVVEVQQNIRSAMEIILKDLRMAGYDGNQTSSRLLTAIFPGDNTNTVRDDAITIQYRINGSLITEVFYRDANTSKLMEDLFVDGVETLTPLLDNVTALTFMYGCDGRIGLAETQDGAIDDVNGDLKIDAADFVSAATVNGGNLNPIAVLVSLAARPQTAGAQDDRFKMVQPRQLISAITIRNLCLEKTY